MENVVVNGSLVSTFNIKIITNFFYRRVSDMFGMGRNSFFEFEKPNKNDALKRKKKTQKSCPKRLK